MGEFRVNEKQIVLLENYDIVVNQTSKGRGAIICDTNKGTMILKEYKGSKEKLQLDQALLEHVQKKITVPIEQLQFTKDEELFVTDFYGNTYILKTYFKGNECNLQSEEEIINAIKTLAKLHKGMIFEGYKDIYTPTIIKLDEEFDKSNKELKRVRNFLRNKKQKNDFEQFLYNEYNYFINQAIEIKEQMLHYYKVDDYLYIKDKGIFCHGDYQHHNILVDGGTMNIINFEKIIMDEPIRDLYLFLRKLLEKNSWSIELGDKIISAYNDINVLSMKDMLKLYYRLAYPEKFWKIVNHYYNTRKVWIPEKNGEKLQRVIAQEKEKQEFLEKIFRNIN